MSRWVFTCAVRLGSVVAGIQTAAPWAGLERDDNRGAKLVALHAGFVPATDAEPAPVVVHLTVAEARALLCDRVDCAEHPPADHSSAWSKVAAATRLVTAP